MADTLNSEKVALVFDWGNTLMKVFSQYQGPMAEWPEVAEMEGVVDALEGLLGRYIMVVATNATDSNAEQVWKALKRVGLGEYFKAVFTFQELGARKPDLRFYRQLESVLAQAPHAMMMIGDDYQVDVLGAKIAGWQAVWYNPHHLAAPGLLPFQNAEVSNLGDLPRLLSLPAMPDYTTCLAWLVERGTPYNILAHIQLVAAVAYQLAVWMEAAGEKVNALLVQRGAMLHDLAKIDSIGTGKAGSKYIDHAEMARKMLLERNQPELAEIASRHMPYRDPNSPRRPQTIEQKLVHYADKLSEGTRLVSIEERLQALKGRYPQAVKEMEESWPLLSQLQEEIAAKLGISSIEMLDRLRKAVRTQ